MILLRMLSEELKNGCRDYGVKYEFLCQLARYYLRVIRSCFSYNRDASIVIDFEYVTKSEVIQVLNEFERSENRPNILRYEFDLVVFILELNKSYERYSFRLTPSCHAIWHAADSLIRLYNRDNFGLGLLNCSELETTHQKISNLLGNQISRDPDSLAYKNVFYSVLNRYNLAAMDAELISNLKSRFSSVEIQ